MQTAPRIASLLTPFLLLLISACSYSQNQGLTGPYLGQPPPAGNQPQLFAPGVISMKDRYEFGSVFSKDGKEFYYAVEPQRGKPDLMHTRLENGQWTTPETLLSHDRYGYNDPMLSPDGQRLYFISDRALDGKGEKKDIDIWYLQRQAGKWSEPVNAGSAINSDKNEYYVSFTSKGTMYFSSNRGTTKENDKNYDIYTASWKAGAFQPARKLGPSVNSPHYEADVFVSPDESYLIWCAERPDGKGRGDLWISFRSADGQWSEAKNMGSAVNTPRYEFCPFVTADGKYLFLSHEGDVYWVSTEVIGNLKQ